MFKKNNFIILFLLCLALVQICIAKPTNDEAKENTTTSAGLCHFKAELSKLSLEKDNQRLPSLQLINFTLSAMLDYLLTFIERAKHKSDQILSDQELLQIANNDEVKTFIQKLQHFQAEYKNCSKNTDYILGLFLYTCADYYEQEELDQLSSDGTVILKVIQKYDFEKLLNDFEIDGKKFVENFAEKYENLKESINNENNKIGERISHWYEEFKTMKDYKKKLNALNQFFDLYKQEFLENKKTS